MCVYLEYLGADESAPLLRNATPSKWNTWTLFRRELLSERTGSGLCRDRVISTVGYPTVLLNSLTALMGFVR